MKGEGRKIRWTITGETILKRKGTQKETKTYIGLKRKCDIY